MNPDLQIARSNDDGSINLALGEPAFLYKHVGYNFTLPKPPYIYPSMDGEQELLKQLEEHHPGWHIVIGNGAKQCLMAACYAYILKKHVNTLYHKAPYWSSYSTIADMSGLQFTSGSYSTTKSLPLSIVCNTYPNNPDGSQTSTACNIWDAVYASQVYGWNGFEPDYEMAIYSAAKKLGLPGLRVGWLVTLNEELAKLARQYIEYTTSGVSTVSQALVAAALKEIYHQRPLHYNSAFEDARIELEHNGFLFNEYLGFFPDEVHGVPKDGTGMFAWFVIDGLRRRTKFEEALKSANVKIVSGKACGATEDGWYRMSMGQTNEVTEKALSLIKDYL